MFCSAFVLNQPLECWDVSIVKNMKRMFLNASSFNQSLASWDVRKVTDFGLIFSGSASAEEWAVI